MSHRILPRPPDVPSTTSSSGDKQRASNKRRTVVAAACNACRVRRTKCDNNRPCRPCVLRNVVCEHDTPAGLTKATHQREQLQKLRSENASMLDMLWYMQSKPLDKSQAFFEQLRNRRLQSIDQLKEWMQSPEGAASILPSERVAFAGPETTPSAADDPNQTPSSLTSGNESESSTPAAWSLLSPGLASSSKPAFAPSPSAPSINISSVLEGLEAYSRLRGSLLTLYTEQRVKKLHEQIANFVQDHESTTFSALTQSQCRPENRYQLAEVAGMASIGLHQLGLSKGKRPIASTTINVLQEYTKTILRDLIDSTPIKGVNLCGLLTTFCIVNKATVAMAYVELGIGLGHSRGLNVLAVPTDANVEDFEESRRIWRTLLLCSSWLGATLDCVALTGPAALQLPMKQADFDDATRETLKQVTLRIRTIKARSFIVNNVDNVTDIVLLNELRLELEQLYENLPAWMSMHRLATQQGPGALRQSIYYIHQFYLSALQLLYRHTMVDESLFDPDAQLNKGDLQVKAISEGLMAAKMAAKVLHLMQTEGLFVQICWLCMFSSYTTPIILLYAAVQKILTGHIASDWNGELHLAQFCIDCLAESAGTDQTAAKLHALLTGMTSIIESELDGLLNVPSSKLHSEHDSVQHLFVVHSGPTILEKLSRDLLRLIRQPFARSLESNLDPALSPNSVYSTLEQWMEDAIGTPMVWCMDLQSGDLYRDAASATRISQIPTNELSLLMPTE